MPRPRRKPQSPPPIARNAGDSDILLAALNGEPKAWEALIARFHPYLDRAIRNRFRGYTDEDASEVEQEVLHQLSRQPAAAFDPATTTAGRFIAGFISNGIKPVRAAYRPAGQRSRTAKPAHPSPERHNHRWYIRPLEAAVVERTSDPRAEAMAAAVDARLQLQLLAQVAEPDVAHAMVLMTEWDLTVEEGGAAVGLRRLTFRRRLRDLPARRQRQAEWAKAIV
jgi:hypothetical protein